MLENASIRLYRHIWCPLRVYLADEGVVGVRFGLGKERDLGHDFSRVIRQLDEYFKGKQKAFELPLVYDHSTFNGRVLSALIKVPHGCTISYQELARKSGHPNACRAVGNVMARNPLPIFIPCHRVIKADGSLGCFGGGVGLKRRLLEMEGVGSGNYGAVKS
jgi:methylated-DNA-[protein]-cysteine S-methyltransferase